MAAKYQVDITRTAEGDIEEIWNHIGADSIGNATRFVIQLEEKISTLQRSPHRCPSIPENRLLGTEYRHLLLGDYRVLFRVAASNRARLARRPRKPLARYLILRRGLIDFKCV